MQPQTQPTTLSEKNKKLIIALIILFGTLIVCLFGVLIGSTLANMNGSAPQTSSTSSSSSIKYTAESSTASTETISTETSSESTQSSSVTTTVTSDPLAGWTYNSYGPRETAPGVTGYAWQFYLPSGSSVSLLGISEGGMTATSPGVGGDFALTMNYPKGIMSNIDDVAAQNSPAGTTTEVADKDGIPVRIARNLMNNSTGENRALIFVWSNTTKNPRSIQISTRASSSELNKFVDTFLLGLNVID